jgi:hypothetical protein
VRQTITSGKKRNKAAMHSTVGVRRREEAEAAALVELGSIARVGVLRLQRETQELECVLK